jgi:hypothetical protein
MSDGTRYPTVAPPATTPKAKKVRPIPPKLKICLEAMLDGRAKSMAEGAKVAGCTRQYIWNTLNKRPDALAWIQARAAKMLGLGAAAATARMMELMHSDSSRTAFESSRFVLGLNGFRVANDPSVNINLVSTPRAGFLIDLREDNRSPLPDVTMEEGAAGAVIVDGDATAPKMIDAKVD